MTTQLNLQMGVKFDADIEPIVDAHATNLPMIAVCLLTQILRTMQKVDDTDLGVSVSNPPVTK
jgi:hypothetical protein